MGLDFSKADTWSGIGGAFQGLSSAWQSYASGAASAKNVAEQNRFNRESWEYNWGEMKRDYRHQMEGVEINRQNNALEREWRDQSALDNWKYGMAIRDYEYKMQMRAYQKSEQTFAMQMQFNRMAAQVAKESEDRFLSEQLIDTAFQNQDIMVQALQGEGAAQMQQSGKSAGKAVQAVIAQAGRNQAILAESLLSAKKQYHVNVKKIKTDWYGANIQADANRMLKPQIAPALPKPLPMPVPIFQDPREPVKPPKPAKQYAISTTGSTIGGILGAAVSIGSAIATSDTRLKENIELVGQSDSGINIYEFNYIDGHGRFRGVLAQELLTTHPEAVIEDEYGYYKVNYDLIDVEMTFAN